MLREAARLLAGARPAREDPISAAEFTRFPHPVARYLALAGVAGKLVPRTVHVLQSGAMLTAPGKRWVPLEAEQWFSLDPPGFLWRGSNYCSRNVIDFRNYHKYEGESSITYGGDVKK